MRLKRQNRLNKRTRDKIIKLIKKQASTEETTIHPFQIVSVSIEIFSLAENILLQYARRFSIGTNDALHLAILQTLNHQAIMVTSDGSMQHVCERLQIPFDDPEKTI
ncbi:hypothetical protein THIOM_004871 [Candidatus Thiomargarita nelsonii]|uniref:PIN domain-containing protein n=1 Tax=Candidatus Thiomargarita nelsonii TaxID=1003181 RepID=A0A176RUS8_9GAMM|nr:hypothetical protein THIOM_004871 [Candidatus Thiomargarita nelsonii]